jgi:hypothetical protein
MNSIRPDALASLLLNGEARNGNRPAKGERPIRDLSLERAVSSKIGMHGVVGDRMVRSWSGMNQGSRPGEGTAFMVFRRPEAQKALEQIEQRVEENGLKLHPTKTRLVDASQRGGFDFLGYHFERGRKWPRKKSLDKLKDAIQSKTRRKSGRSMKAICADLNSTLKGWYEYFKHSAPHVFKGIDGYVRGRLRSILRRQTKRKGRARGTDQLRWPNAYFSAVGLFSLEQARTAASMATSWQESGR